MGLSSNNIYAYTLGDELTGDTKLACEAVLCLSTSSRPSECNSAIKRYFSIRMRKPHDTIRARLNFLKLCPTDVGLDKEVLAKIGVDEEEQKVGLDGLTQTIANLPYDCTPESLNQQIEKRRACSSGECETYYRIKPTLPKSCRDLANHQWTVISLPVYKGNYKWSSYRPSKPVWFLEK
ncbi:conjugal transfer protein TrbM [Pasteurella multocida]|nr:conjugal transfer protein TrbM [Pasteurella multocida]PPE95055.1 conjugal transfer protein TrbM [Pasteurella multocida]HDR1236505.1 conjugal transfer protein TrbM [Pasteurella multocida]HDR1500992.1 conjugal transfer protein TrbM [Pasteurella multocida]